MLRLLSVLRKYDYCFYYFNLLLPLLCEMIKTIIHGYTHLLIYEIYTY